MQMPINRLTLIATLLGLGLATQAAHGETMEERLRAQLRSTTQQLQAVQSEQARVRAEQAQLVSQRDAALAQVKQLTGERDQARQHAEQLAGAQSGLREQASQQVAASQAQVGKFRQAYDELLTLSRGRDAERLKVQASLQQREQELASCTGKNQEMYGLAKDILAAYENIGVAETLRIRQPFASEARVKFEELAQRYGDDLYKTQVDGQAAVTQVQP
ncbi:DNA repair protein [Pseudomonas wadenswilerensis]